jgi:hypothetical protein
MTTEATDPELRILMIARFEQIARETCAAASQTGGLAAVT